MQKDWRKSWVIFTTLFQGVKKNVILPHISRRKKSVTFYRVVGSSWSSKFFLHFCRPNSRAKKKELGLKEIEARPSASLRSEQQIFCEKFCFNFKKNTYKSLICSSTCPNSKGGFCDLIWSSENFGCFPRYSSWTPNSFKIVFQSVERGCT